MGLLQFDVMLHRLEHEYGAPCRLEKLSARYPRWVTGPMDEIERVARDRSCRLLFDAKGKPQNGQLMLNGKNVNWRVRDTDAGLLLTVVAARALQGDWAGAPQDGRWRLQVNLRE